MLLIGATIWTVIIKKAESINGFMVGNASDPAPLGITVSKGNGVYLAWAGFVTLLASILPYMIRYISRVINELFGLTRSSVL